MINPFKSVNFIYQDTHSVNSVLFKEKLIIYSYQKLNQNQSQRKFIAICTVGNFLTPRISLLNASNSKINICSFFAE